MSSARNLQSNVSVSDGTTATKVEKPKAPRPSICARSTADSAAAREKVAAKSKNSAILPNGGKFTAEKGSAVEGSTPKRHNLKEKTSEERQIDSAGMVAAVEAATLRAQSKAKAEASSAEKVLFDKSKRQSMLSEAMRRGAPTSDSTKQVHDESESGRKAASSRDKQSCIFSAPSESGASYRPLRVVNIKTPEAAEKTSKRTITEQAEDAVRYTATSEAENQRKAITAKSHSSSIFATSDSSRPCTGGSVSRSNNIFGGGAYADDAVSVPKMKIP
eukprot:CAMPEP_0172155806 /NCGR_PEP_ID=MMETSP1050-20130122/2834_1 /TAXON_ID=233186 /ORGANISM="Cryptomonas curvata, Strain CCAP979/52" /LENGTH=274 /DNA_ID=CAMNT_0012824753 /DNA_START=73 /DNA_END=894 /DNA_ORIENTATION=-